jgi:hypothetical protein
MHWLADHNRSEFLACPELIRFEYAKRDNGFEPTLLIKGSTLLLKYAVLGRPMHLAFCRFEGRLLCALKICDDGDDGGILWSIVEREQELNAIRGVAFGSPLTVFLFNEIAVNVTWNSIPISGQTHELANWATSVQTGPLDHNLIGAKVHRLLERLHRDVESDGKWITIAIGGHTDWKPIYNHFITNAGSSSLIDLFDPDEGKQQEQIGVWLTDNLHPLGVHYSPQIPKGNGTRELTDILLSYEFGSILLESKALSVLSRDRMPDRTKLKADVSGHIAKAFAQLRGGIRKIRASVEVTGRTGERIDVERTQPPHAIVLIPDLDLVDDPTAYGTDFIKDFMEKTGGGFPHLLDISELLRVVQAAEMISKQGSTTTPMMAFDYYLMERFKKAVDAGTLKLEVLLRFVNDPNA